MSETQLKLFNQLWAIANELRGKMDASEFKNYMLGFIFYKFLSEKIDDFMNNELASDKINFVEAFADDKHQEEQKALQAESLTILGYFLAPKYLFKTLVEKADKKEFILRDLQEALNHIEQSTMGHASQEDFIGLFDDVDLQSSKLGKSEENKNKIISAILKHLAKIDFDLANTDTDVLGDAYEYLIGQFASDAGKKAGEFYTPQAVSTILAKLVSLDKEKIKSAYDPTCGSGSLLLRIQKETKVAHFTGQELNQTTYNLARMNMLLHGVRYDDFEIVQGDTLEDPLHLSKRFEAIVANPPFSAHWKADDLKNKDERFSAYGKLAPKTKADFAFVQHMVHHLDENGIMAVVLPHGVLFRSAGESQIRKFLIAEKNYLDAVIGLPANIFYGTSIPTCILVFKKCRIDADNILFIDASKHFEKRKNQSHLTQTHIDKIITTYKTRQAVDKYSSIATLDQIKENDYNLNIPRYVDTFEPEVIIDLDQVYNDLQTLNTESQAIDVKIKGFCDELGIKAPLF